MNLAQYSLDNTKIVYFFLAVLLIGGILSFGRLGKKEDAPFVIKSAVIMTRYPGAEPAEVERLVTEPISREIQSMSGVYKIKSESMYGLSKITFELQPSLSAASIPQKWDELRRKVLNIQPQLPAGSSVPTVSDDFGDVFGIYYGLVGDDGFSYEEMRNWAERIKTQVITADGVMKVALFGTQTEVIHIFISVNKLAGMGIDPKQLASLLQSQNQIINTGEISAGEQQLRIVANGTYTSLWRDVPFDFIPDSLNLMRYNVYADWEPGESYTFEVDSTAFQGIYGLFTDKVKKEFKVKKPEEYGQIFFDVSGADSLAFVDLLDAQDKVVRTVPVVNGRADFYFLNPGKYSARLINDRNGNGVWDTGKYEDKRQPEEVYYYYQVLELKANFDLTQSWNIHDRPLDQQKPGELKKQKPDEDKKKKNQNNRSSGNRR